MPTPKNKLVEGIKTAFALMLILGLITAFVAWCIYYFRVGGEAIIQGIMQFFGFEYMVYPKILHLVFLLGIPALALFVVFIVMVILISIYGAIFNKSEPDAKIQTSSGNNAIVELE